jgi:hypothetical protein
VKAQWVDYMELTHRFIRLNLSHTPDGEDFHYVDLARHLSAMNRRLYRQGMQYHVANIAVHDSQGDAYVKFCTLPNTWTTMAAWRRGFKLWKEQRADVQSNGLSLSGKWSDFKVLFNDDHRDDVDVPVFKDIENDSLAYGEWDYSRYVIQDDDGNGENDFLITMMGANNGSIAGGAGTSASLLTALEDAMGVVPDDPIVPDTANSGLFGLLAGGLGGQTVSNDLIQLMEDDNDSPPYSATLVPGARTNCDNGWEVREIHLGAGGAAPSGMVGGFEVPLGLLQIETKSSTTNNTIGIVIELVPGKYKGVQAEGWA